MEWLSLEQEINIFLVMCKVNIFLLICALIIKIIQFIKEIIKKPINNENRIE